MSSKGWGPGDRISALISGEETQQPSRHSCEGSVTRCLWATRKLVVARSWTCGHLGLGLPAPVRNKCCYIASLWCLVMVARAKTGKGGGERGKEEPGVRKAPTATERMNERMNGHRDAEVTQPLGQTRSMHVTSRLSPKGSGVGHVGSPRGTDPELGVGGLVAGASPGHCRGWRPGRFSREACLHCQAGVLI